MTRRTRRSPSPGRSFSVLVTALALTGCGHSEPFEDPAHGTDSPLVAGEPSRLTYNPGDDLEPAWLPDGAAFIYSYDDPEQPDDACLGVMGAGGGRLRQTVCNRSVGSSDSLDLFRFPAVNADGRLAYYRGRGRGGAASPSRQEIRLAPLADPQPGDQAVPIPFTAADGRTLTGIADLDWLTGSRLVLLGSQQASVSPCPFCDPIQARFTRDVLTLDPGGTPQLVAGTTFATSVAPAPAGDAIYYTLPNDARVYRLPVAGGDPAVAHDFGAKGPARDIRVMGDRLVAVVGGKVSVIDDPTLGPVQLDEGGLIAVVDLTTGAEQVIEGVFRLYRNPAISPDGTRIVTEGYPIEIETIYGPDLEPIGADTIVLGGADLWLYGQP